MLRSGAPTQLTQVFAGGSGAGPTNVVPLTPTGSQPAGQIAYSTGFTSTNMTPIASGGIAPWGADMNGLLKAQTQAQIYQQAGFFYPYSSVFSTAMSGYPAGAVLPMASGLGLWLNQTDSNTTDPDSSGASGWVPQPANQGMTALTGLTGGTVVLTPNQLGAPLITLAGTLTSNLQVTLPLSAGRTYTIQNNTTGAYTVTVAGATGTGVTITQGAANGTTVYTDGTNWYTGQFNGAGVYLPIAGTAVAATKLATARTIAMTGDVSWTSPAFDGTANVTAAGTIAAGAVTLAKMAAFQANSIMGNPTSSSATPSAITLASPLQFSGNTLGLSYAPLNKAGDTMLGALTIQTSGSTGSLLVIDSGSSGANIALRGNGASTPDKSIRAYNGNLEFLNNAYSAVIMSLTDAGALSLANNLTVNGGNVQIGSSASTYRSINYLGVVTSGSTIDPGASGGAASLAFSTSGSFGGGIGLIDGTYNWGIWDYSGTLVFGSGTSNGALTQKMTLTASGNLTTYGTSVNFNASDADLKRDFTEIDPAPLHRHWFGSYVRTDTGATGIGHRAQDIRATHPHYVPESDTVTVVDRATGKERPLLLLDKVGMAIEQGVWCGRQIDRIWEALTAAGIGSH